jgi:hypothetical protein
MDSLPGKVKIGIAERVMLKDGIYAECTVPVHTGVEEWARKKATNEAKYARVILPTSLAERSSMMHQVNHVLKSGRSRYIWL